MLDSTFAHRGADPGAYTLIESCVVLTNVCADCGRCLTAFEVAFTKVCAD